MSLNDPVSRLPQVPSFTVQSSDVTDGQPLATEQHSGMFGIPGGTDTSPQLSWTGAPEGTKSYAVTMYDPDAPTGSGFWHWAVMDIPATTTELRNSAGTVTAGLLPSGAISLRNDGGFPGYLGAAPPAGHGEHRYFVVVSALDIETLGLAEDATPALLGFNIANHILGRAILTATAETLP